MLDSTEKIPVTTATTVLRNRLDQSSCTMAAQDFRHAMQKETESVADFIRRLKQTFRLPVTLETHCYIASSRRGFITIHYDTAKLMKVLMQKCRFHLSLKTQRKTSGHTRTFSCGARIEIALIQITNVPRIFPKNHPGILLPCHSGWLGLLARLATQQAKSTPRLRFCLSFLR